MQEFYKNIKLPATWEDFQYSIYDAYDIQTEQNLNEIDTDDLCSLRFYFKSAIVDFIENLNLVFNLEEKFNPIFDTTDESIINEII